MASLKYLKPESDNITVLQARNKELRLALLRAIEIMSTEAAQIQLQRDQPKHQKNIDFNIKFYKKILDELRSVLNKNI